MLPDISALRSFEMELIAALCTQTRLRVPSDIPSTVEDHITGPSPTTHYDSVRETRELRLFRHVLRTEQDVFRRPSSYLPSYAVVLGAYNNHMITMLETMGFNVRG